MRIIMPVRLRWDLYGLGPFFVAFAVIQILSIIFLYAAPNTDSWRQTVFFLFDLVIPLLFSSLVLFVFSRDITPKNISFLFSLPLKMGSFILLRYIRLFLFWWLLCIPFLLACYGSMPQTDSAAVITFGHILSAAFAFLPNTLCFAAVSLFLLTVTKSTFSPFILLFGVSTFDFCTFGKILRVFSVTANYYTELKSTDLFFANRLLFLCFGFIGPILSYIKMKTDYIRNKG